MENSSNGQFVTFKLHAILGGMIKVHAIQTGLTQDVNHPLVPHFHLHSTTH